MSPPKPKLCLALALLAACSGEAGADADMVNGADAGAAAGAGAVRFSALYDEVLTTCRIDICHGNNVGGLDLSTRAAAYASLVDRPAFPTGICAMFGKRRVVPFQPDQSLLVLKLDIRPPCGQQMPVGGTLPDAERERIRQWIALGAHDD